jgi:hypothetical protein
MLLDAKVAKVQVEIISMRQGSKLKAKSKPRTRKQDESEIIFKSLKHAIYGEINEELLPQPTQGPSDDELITWMVARGQAADRQEAMAALAARRAEVQAARAHEIHYSLGNVQTGTWTAAASDIMRRDRTLIVKFHETRALCEVVMGDADYHPNPCILICPFATCRKSHYHLNGFSAVSQLYSHWKKKHGSSARTHTRTHAGHLLRWLPMP